MLRHLLIALALACGLVAPAAAGSSTWTVTKSEWTAEDEKGYSAFIQKIGESSCETPDDCINSDANPYRGTDGRGIDFNTDCADLIYMLRAYYAWKNDLPFSYVDGVSSRGGGDVRFSSKGNRVGGRRNVTGGESGRTILNNIRDAISSATFRIGPDIDDKPLTDLYPMKIQPGSIRPGTAIYDVNGHVALVYKVGEDGRVFYMDAHPDYTLTRSVYGAQFGRDVPGMGAGFKNWRPIKLVGAAKAPDGTYLGGKIERAKNAELADYSTQQFFGNGERPADREWASGTFTLDGQVVDYYDYMRAMMGGGSIAYEPVQEVRNMIRSNCDDVRYRADAVDLAVAQGIHLKPQPPRLPQNIYGTEGEWEEYSSPSRDARLKTSFKELRDQVQRMVEWHAAGDKRVRYEGTDLLFDLLNAYDQEASACTITYLRTNGLAVQMGYEEVRRRMFLLSFDPYHCIERRWGATLPAEAMTCRDDATKTEWYAAEQYLRNQIDRTYDARMDFDLSELKAGPGPGKGVATPPDIDTRGYLIGLITQRKAASPAVSPVAH